MEKRKKCTRCKRYYWVNEFRKDSSKKDGLQCACKKCMKKGDTYYKRNKEKIAEKAKIYYEKNKNRIADQRKSIPAEKKREWTKIAYHKDIKKSRARVLLRTHVHLGKIKKPDSCSRCGKSNCRIEGHHWNGYTGKNKLNVVWLCSTCHKYVHSNEIDCSVYK